jgi:hypothetical protein
MIPDLPLLTFAISILIAFARYAKFAKDLLMQTIGRNLIGSLRNGRTSARPPQAVASTE